MTTLDIAAGLTDISNGNTTTGITFRLEQVLMRGTIEDCYAGVGQQASENDLLRACATLTEGQLAAVIQKLKLKFSKDFRERAFRNQVKDARLESASKEPDHGMLLSAAGTPKPLLANAIHKLASIITLGYDTFSSRITIMEPTPWGTAGPWSDRDDLEATTCLQRGGIECGTATGHEAAEAVAHRNPFHPVRDWLSVLEWDGIPRVGELMPKYFRTREGVYPREIGRMWMISAVARIMRPGCQAKYMVVLEGAQDEGKSKGLRALTNGHLSGDDGRQWYRDGLPRLNDKDIGSYMQGVWIIEVAELAGFQRSEQEEIKAFLSRQTEIFRKSYGRNIKAYPRQCVFAGTVNVNKGCTPEWGKDHTGLVRFWPIRTGEPDIDAIIRDYDQLWAEAVHMFKNGCLWYGDRDFAALAKKEQDQRAPEMTVHRDKIVAAIDKVQSGMDFDGWLNIGMILDATNIPTSLHDRLKRDVGDILRQEGWTGQTHRFVRGAQSTYGFTKGGEE